jgi:transcriptional regulator with XRE-family HTH domain
MPKPERNEEMAKKGDPRVLRHLVTYLRTEANMTQAAFGKAANVDQGDISSYELGKDAPSDKILRRMAQVPNVPWTAVVHLRRFLTTMVAALDRLRAGVGAGADDSLHGVVVETLLLAVSPHLLEIRLAGPQPRSREEEESEAEEVWTALERFPVPRRRELLEMSPPVSRTQALAERVRRAAVEAAARNAEDAEELADLARFVAAQMEQGLQPTAS